MFHGLFVGLVLVLSQSSAFANQLEESAKNSLVQYADENKIDLNEGESRLFGFSVETHEMISRVTIFNTIDPMALTRASYICQATESQQCWLQPIPTKVVYSRSGALYSGEILLNALREIRIDLESRGVAAERLTLFKIWQGPGGISSRIGVEASLVEIGYDCDPGKARACRLAEAPFQNEP